MLAWEWVVIRTTKMARFSKITTTKKFNRSEKNLVSLTTMRRLMLETTQLSIGQWLSSKTTPDMRESGSSAKTSVKVKEDRSGQMDQCMRAGGKITKLMEKEDLFMLMVTSTTANGLMIRLMDSVSIAISMEPNMRATGKRISNMVMDLKPGQMVPNTRVNTSKVKKMERADSHGLMAPHITECSMRTIFKEPVSITGPTVENIMVSG